MKIVLLNPPGKELYLRDQHCSSVSKAYYYWPAIDLIVQSGILSEEHELHAIDAIINKMGEEECLNDIIQFKPDCVVFVTGNVSWIEDFTFMEKVKEKTGAIIIASGGFLRSDYERIMEKYHSLDAVLLDFCSDAIAKYLKGQYNELYDICFRQGENIVVKPISRVKEFSIPVPRHELFPLKKYRLPHSRLKPFSSVITNYGCPFECSFCIAECINFKYRPVSNVMDELEKLVSMGVKEIFFKDFTFGVPKKIATDLCKQIIERFPGLSWICSSRVDVLDKEMLQLLKKAGCHTIQFGVETSSQQLLDKSNKQTSVEQIKYIFNQCKKLGIKTLAHFILGLPGETEESILRTLQLAKEIKCDYASFNIAIPIPGTSLRSYCIENDLIKGEYEILDSSSGYPVIETPLLSREKLWSLRNHVIRTFYLRPSYIIRKLIHIRSPRDLAFLFKEGITLIASIK